MDYLKNTNAKVKFLSCEPLLEDLGVLDLKGINWVIAGGESGRNARPCEPDWVRNIQKQCKEQGVPFFFKQWGEWLPEVNNEFTFENLLTQRKCRCKGCFYSEILETTCKMKYTVIQIIKVKGLPPKELKIIDIN